MSKNTFSTFNVRTVANGTETISFREPKNWSLVPEEIKNSNSLPEFNIKINKLETRWAHVHIVQNIYSKPRFHLNILFISIYIPNLGFT